MEFTNFEARFERNFKELTTNETHLYSVDVDTDELWNLYLDSFPAGTNNIYRTRREYDCSCCRHFIKTVGNVVAIKNNSIKTIWDFDTNFVERDSVRKWVSKAMAASNIKLPTNNEEKIEMKDVMIMFKNGSTLKVVNHIWLDDNVLICETENGCKYKIIKTYNGKNIAQEYLYSSWHATKDIVRIGNAPVDDSPYIQMYTDIINTEKYARYDTKITEIALNKIYGYKTPNILIPKIKEVMFNDPATIVFWSDDTKTVVKAENEKFDPEKGLAMAISKKALGNNYSYYNEFDKQISKYLKKAGKVASKTAKSTKKDVKSK